MTDSEVAGQAKPDPEEIDQIEREKRGEKESRDRRESQPEKDKNGTEPQRRK